MHFTLFGSRAQQLIGLDVSTSAVKLLELSTVSPQRWRVERYAIESLPTEAVEDGQIVDLEGVSVAIERGVRRLGTKVGRVAMALPASAVISRKIMLPAGLREREMELHVEAEAGQYIPFSLDEVNLDFQVLGPAPTGEDEIEVLIAASRRDRVDERVAAAEGAGLQVEVMDVESFATEAAFALIDQDKGFSARDQVVALADIGASVMTVSMLHGGAQLYMREQPVGGRRLTQDIARQYGMSLEEAETAKRMGELPGDYQQQLLQPFVESVALEIARALQFFFTSTQFDRVDQVLLAGGPAITEGLAQAVAERTHVPTGIANPFAGMSASKRVSVRQLELDAPALMIACGLALRETVS